MRIADIHTYMHTWYIAGCCAEKPRVKALTAVVSSPSLNLVRLRLCLSDSMKEGDGGVCC